MWFATTWSNASRPSWDLLGETDRSLRVAQAVDAINGRFGRHAIQHAIQPAVRLGMGSRIPDRISFGSVKDLDAFLFDSTDEEAEDGDNY